MLTHRLAALLLASAVGAPAAYAQSDTSSNPTPFVILKRQDETSKAGVDLGYVKVDGADLPQGGVRLDLYGQFVNLAGIGGYINVPISALIIEDADDQIAVGGIELGAIYAQRTPTGSFALHAGATLPIASDDLDSLFANSIGALVRIIDLAQALPKTTVGRLGGAYVYRQGGVVARAEAGLDIPLFTTSDNFEIDRTPLAHVNLAGGVEGPRGGVALEVVTLIDLDAPDGSDSTFNMLGLSGSLSGGSISPHGGIYLSEDGTDFVIIVGAQAPLRF